MVAAYRLHSRVTRRRAMWTAGAFVLGLVTYLATENTYAAGLAGFVACLVITHLATLYLVVPPMARRLYRQQKNLHFEHRVSWDDQCVYVRSENYNENIRWADLVKAKENEATVLLYRSDYNLNFIPKRSFPSADAYAEFRSHLVPRFLK